MKLLAIDPGPEQSAWVLFDLATSRPERFAKEDNEGVRWVVSRMDADFLAIETVQSYGMPVGAEVFETCRWSGRFHERWDLDQRGEVFRVYRSEVKLHLCNARNAKDSNVRAALIDRYGPGRERAIGKRAAQGPLYGISGDCWAALGVAVTCAETSLGAQPWSGRADASDRSTNGNEEGRPQLVGPASTTSTPGRAQKEVED